MPELISTPQEVVAGLKALVLAVEAGDDSALPLLRAELARIEDRQLLERVVPSPAGWALRLTRQALCGEGGASSEAVRRHAELLQAELEGPEPSAVERLLAGRVVVSWLCGSLADAACAKHLRSDSSLRVRDFWMKQAARFERRLLQASAALARVRKLAVPRLSTLLQPPPAVPNRSADEA